MDWTQVRAFLLGGKAATEDHGDLLVVPRRMGERDCGAEERVERVKVKRVDLAGRGWVELRATVCPDSDLEPRRALVHNGTAIVGAVALDGRTYCVRHALALEPLTGRDLALVIDLIAHEALRLRKRILGAVGSTACFDTYCD